MSGKGALLSAAVLAMPTALGAQDFSEAQAINERFAPQIVAAISAGDAAAITRLDSVIDYSPQPVRYNNPTVDGIAAIALFDGCQTPSVDAAIRNGDRLFINYSCPDRTGYHRCFTGDLKVVLHPGVPVSISIYETIDRAEQECYPVAPTSPARRPQ